VSQRIGIATMILMAVGFWGLRVLEYIMDWRDRGAKRPIKTWSPWHSEVRNSR